LELGTGAGDQKCGNRAGKKFANNFRLRDRWMDTGLQQRPRFTVKMASNSVNVLLHCLNNTHLLTAVPS